MRLPILLSAFAVLNVVALSGCTFGEATGSTTTGTSHKSSNASSGSSGDNSTSDGTDPGEETNPADPTTPTNPGNVTPTSGASYDLALASPTTSGDMATTQQVSFTLTPKNGFSGAVTLAATGLPANATAAFDNASPSLSGTSATTVKMTITTAANTPPGASKVHIAATSGSVTQGSDVTMTINPKLTIPIRMNATQSNYVDPQYLNVDTGGMTVAVKFQNMDSTPHIIHAGSPNFPHGDTTPGNEIGANGGIEQGTTRSLKGTENVPFYLHDLNQPGNEAAIKSK